MFRFERRGLGVVWLLAVGLWLVGCTAGNPATPTATAAAMRTDDAIQAARAALEAWLDALRAGDCTTVVAGLARSSPLWEGRAALEDACRQGDAAALEAWRAARVGPVVMATDARVVFHLEGDGAAGYAVLVREDGTWRYAGDVFASWSPRPAACEDEALQALWGPVWDRAAGVSVGLSLTNRGAQPLTWDAGCAVLRWADGTETPAESCPQDGLEPGATWRGELFFPKPAEAQGRPWAAAPKRVHLQLRAADGAAVTLICTWKAQP